MKTKTWDIVRAYQPSKHGTLVVVIPKKAHEFAKVVKGTKFLVKTDERGRIIYEPVEGSG